MTTRHAHKKNGMGTDTPVFNENTYKKEVSTSVCPANHDEIVRMAKMSNPMNHITSNIKRSVLEKCDGYQTLFLLEDYLLWLNMIAWCEAC